MRLDHALLKLEFDRKIFHVAWALLPLLYYFGYPRDGMLLLLFIELLIWIGVEAVRKTGYPIVSAELMREHEKQGAPMGTLYQITSLFLAVLFFDREIAILAMLFCCIGDSVTAFAGAILLPYLGRGKTAIRTLTARESGTFSSAGNLLQALVHRKSAILMLVMFGTCLALGYLFFPRQPLAVIVAGCLGAVIADAFAWRVAGITMNDDLTIPLVSGALMSLLVIL